MNQMGGPPDPMGAQKRAHLYVGNLSSRVTEYMLHEIFAVAGPVLSVKIIPDRNYQHGGLNYGFVEYNDMRAAENALQSLNGRKIFDTEIRVNWAYQGSQAKEDTTGHSHVFVGDLSPEVTDQVLQKAFSAFGSLSDARVMWDMNSNKSRGYGFLAFRDKTDAEQAIATMNGEWLGSRAIRVNWANQKGNQHVARPVGGAGSAPAPSNLHFKQGYEDVVKQTADFNTTVYVGNVAPETSQNELIQLFMGFGYLHEIRFQPERGFAFVKLDTHENAAKAIVHLWGTNVRGRVLKFSWGKDRQDGGAMQPITPMSPSAGTAAPYGGGMDMQAPYGMPPQSNAYGQYGFGYPGFGTGAVAGTPGMPQAAATPGAVGSGAASPGADAAAQAQWAAANPNYYQNFWGGMGGYYGQSAAGGQGDATQQPS
ncbi:hypothetical protein SCHPADRAFT_920868 [Schizopora paradoxa]|uniref:RRM domain-containing protein n=1 Tax=Schizopora paradoxa TaxID=27342 RepID=A0A0H2SAS1_9AGAM|nr:hypothetical protein SCHPADRAFT_920868 [Schizopora paradoxa]